MKKIKIINHKHYLMLAFILFFIASCNNSDKNSSRYYPNISKNNADDNSKISYKSVINLYINNKKIIDIASRAFVESKQFNESNTILQIKKDHLKIENDIKKYTSKNLIIIPKPIYDLKLNQTYLNGEASNFYLITLLKKEINNQIRLLDSIIKTSNDNELKKIAEDSKKNIQHSSKKLDSINKG